MILPFPIRPAKSLAASNPSPQFPPVMMIASLLWRVLVTFGLIFCIQLRESRRRKKRPRALRMTVAPPTTVARAPMIYQRSCFFCYLPTTYNSYCAAQQHHFALCSLLFTLLWALARRALVTERKIRPQIEDESAIKKARIAPSRKVTIGMAESNVQVKNGHCSRLKKIMRFYSANNEPMEICFESRSSDRY